MADVIPFGDPTLRRVLEKLQQLPPEEQFAVERAIDVLLLLDKLPDEHHRTAIDLLKKFAELPVAMMVLLLDRLDELKR